MIVKLLGSTGAFLAISFFAAVYMGLGQFHPDIILNDLKAYAARELQVDISWEYEKSRIKYPFSARIELFQPSLTLHETSGFEPERILEADSITLDFSLWDLILKRLVINAEQIENPQLTLHRNLAGDWSWMAVVNHRQRMRTQKVGSPLITPNILAKILFHSRPWQFALSPILLTDGQFRLLDDHEIIKLENWVPITEIELNKHAARELFLISMELSRGLFSQFPLQIKMEYDALNRRMSYDINGIEDQVQANGEIDLSQSPEQLDHVSGNLEIMNINLTKLRDLFSPIAPTEQLRGTMSCEVELSGPLRSVFSGGKYMNIKGVFDIRNGELMGENIVQQVLDSIDEQYPPASDTEGFEVPGYLGFVNSDRLPFGLLQSEIKSSRGVIEVKHFRLKDRLYFIEGEGSIIPDRETGGQSTFNAYIVFYDQFSGWMMNRNREMSFFLNSNKSIVIPFKYGVNDQGVRVEIESPAELMAIAS